MATPGMYDSTMGGITLSVADVMGSAAASDPGEARRIRERGRKPTTQRECGPEGALVPQVGRAKTSFRRQKGEALGRLRRQRFALSSPQAVLGRPHAAEQGRTVRGFARER